MLGLDICQRIRDARANECRPAVLNCLLTVSVMFLFICNVFGGGSRTENDPPSPGKMQFVHWSNYNSVSTIQVQPGVIAHCVRRPPVPTGCWLALSCIF